MFFVNFRFYIKHTTEGGSYGYLRIQKRLLADF